MDLVEFDRCANVVSLFLARADALGEAPMLWAKREGEWTAISWAEAARRVCLLAEGLRARGLRDGERVLIVSENRPEWCLADLAIMAAGCVTVPTYTTNTTRDHTHILENSGACAAIVSSAKLAKPLLPAIVQTDLCRHVVGMEALPSLQGGNFATSLWDDMLTGDAQAARAAVEARLVSIGRDSLACIIYTSGTGGAPRGVRQHHGMLLTNIAGTTQVPSSAY